MSETQFPAPSGGKKSTALWIVILVLVAVAVLGYYYYSAYEGEAPYESTGSIDTDSEAADDAALAAELEAIDLENLDAELGEIDKELAQ